MPGGWPTLKAVDFDAMQRRQFLAAIGKNGSQTHDNSSWPSLTADDLMALVEYWQSQSRRNNIAWPGWYPLALIAMGYKKMGDKFPSGVAWRKTVAKSFIPVADLATVWDEIEDAAKELDGLDPSMRKPTATFTKSGDVYGRWKRGANAAWEKLRRVRGKIPPPPGPIPFPGKPKVPPVFDPLPGPTNPFAGTVNLLLFGALLYFAATTRN